ncbi:MAG: thiamine pyrophosphate-dependent dehydrogenase E1 component subunit alpha [Gammaproteobacteria bacterium]|jgi:TPP-dependent pyruvate/acetoin dehydrogenase alpha subunit|nr:thiamine pyrophosphate-dependent dehydrogenase E1 component subunit alpha [Gammaproteobacteria bacterium]|tara:strand:- start:418 stop:1386 length:969 start_codon:yes stop_codon:yes gene_type:complete
MPISPAEQRQMLRTMQLIRRFEERASRDYLDDKIYGVVHCYIGEEAVAVGVCSALREDDQIISTHRGHGHCIAKGADINRMMAELYGRETGYCKGKGGSMHIADFDIGMLGANGIVAGGIPIITGAAFAAQLRGAGSVAVCFFGDGASNAGSFHESINIAASWNLPIIYVCENNLWAVNTPSKASMPIDDIATRATAYGIPGIVVDGNDVLAVREVATEAVDRARNGEGPSLIECKTYRHRRHTERATQPDARPHNEVSEWMEKDPIDRLKMALNTQQGQLTDSEWEAMDQEIIKLVDTAVTFAATSPFPPVEAAGEDVFAE